MDITQVWIWIKNNLGVITLAISLILNFERVVVAAAQQAGYTWLVNFCNKFTNLLTFIGNIIGGIISKQQIEK
jgi:hypothetical protein